jgi:hypothetical protein
MPAVLVALGLMFSLMGLLFVILGFKSYVDKRTPLRGGGSITGKKAQALGLVVVLGGLVCSVSPFLFLVGYIGAADWLKVYFGSMVVVFVLIAVIRDYYNPRDYL